MTDGGALPAWFSRSAATLRESGWLAATVSVGQAFGGDLEAVTLHTGLLAARHVLGADLVVVAQGPGNLGHRHPLGVLRASRRARRSTPPRCSAAGRWRACASPAPTRADGTRACRTTA